MTREMGKVLAEARGDVQEGVDIAYLMAGEGRRMFGDTVPSELPDKWAMSIRQPIGVAGIITPWRALTCEGLSLPWRVHSPWKKMKSVPYSSSLNVSSTAHWTNSGSLPGAVFT